VVIFVKDQSRAKMLNTVLNECNFPSDCIYGGMDQQKRLDVYSKFRNNQVGHQCGEGGKQWRAAVGRPRLAGVMQVARSSHLAVWVDHGFCVCPVFW
jgi:hypothetical protein